MAKISQNNPVRKALIQLVHSIENEIGLDEENIVLILHLLDTEEKIFRFNRWVRSNLKDGAIQATEAEVCRAAVKASKGQDN